jgi:phosphoribosylformylglycinamidine cyclo-ligase
VIEAGGVDLASAKLDGQALADLVLAPTRIYVKPVLDLLQRLPVKGLAHITGGGLVENVPRVLADHLTARLDSSAWPLLPLFAWLEAEGHVPRQEMWRVFNCGIGMVLIVDAAHAQSASETLRSAGESVYRIGEIERRLGDEPQTIIV